MKKKLLPYAFSLALVLVAVFVLWQLFAPRPIVARVEGSRVNAVSYNPQFNQEDAPQDAPVLLAGYDEAAILEVLSRYSEQRAPRRGPEGTWGGNIQLMIMIMDGDRSKIIVLGNVYYHQFAGKPKYNILEGEQLRAELMALLDTSRTY